MLGNLRDAIDQDVFRLDDDRFTDADFQAMSIDELERIKLRINKRISNISASITNKKIEDGGKKAASKDWYKRYNAALSINERVSAYLKNMIAERLRTSKTTGDYFMRHAKAVLPRELFERILYNAQQDIANRGIV
jgi:hypothetical protein